MKHILIAMMMVCTLGVSAKTITKTIKVNGNCDDCKAKIEAALDVQGISFAEWNKETKMLTVRFNDKKISEDDIHLLISNTGYSTDQVAANAVEQAKLKECCKPKEKKACGAKAGCCTKKKS